MPSPAYVLVGGALGATGVVLGAAGAHWLGADADVGVWRTAVLYHLVHAVAILAIGLALTGPHVSERQHANQQEPNSRQHRLRIAGAALTIGVLLFSGSLYLLALGGPPLLGPVTPVGGLVLIVGWIVVAAAGLSSPDEY